MSYAACTSIVKPGAKMTVWVCKNSKCRKKNVVLKTIKSSRCSDCNKLLSAMMQGFSVPSRATVENGVRSASAIDPVMQPRLIQPEVIIPEVIPAHVIPPHVIPIHVEGVQVIVNGSEVSVIQPRVVQTQVLPTQVIATQVVQSAVGLARDIPMGDTIVDGPPAVIGFVRPLSFDSEMWRSYKQSIIDNLELHNARVRLANNCYLYHGTTREGYDKIKISGLRPRDPRWPGIMPDASRDGYLSFATRSDDAWPPGARGGRYLLRITMKAGDLDHYDFRVTPGNTEVRTTLMVPLDRLKLLRDRVYGPLS